MDDVCGGGEEQGPATAVGPDDAAGRAALRQPITPLQAVAGIPRPAATGRPDARNGEWVAGLVPPLDGAVESAVQRARRGSADPAGPEHPEGQQRR